MRLGPEKDIKLIIRNQLPVTRNHRNSGYWFLVTNYPYNFSDSWKPVASCQKSARFWLLVSGYQLSMSHEPARFISVRLNDCVSAGDGLCRAGEARYLKIQEQKLSFPWLMASLFRMDKDTYCEEKDTQDAKRYFNLRRKFLKEIAGQSNSKYRFTQVRDKFRNKFPSGIINEVFHSNKNTTVINACQQGKVKRKKRKQKIEENRGNRGQRPIFLKK